jgi:hypothetical protein
MQERTVRDKSNENFDDHYKKFIIGSINCTMVTPLQGLMRGPIGLRAVVLDFIQKPHSARKQIGDAGTLARPPKKRFSDFMA